MIILDTKVSRQHLAQCIVHCLHGNPTEMSLTQAIMDQEMRGVIDSLAKAMYNRSPIADFMSLGERYSAEPASVDRTGTS